MYPLKEKVRAAYFFYVLQCAWRLNAVRGYCGRFIIRIEGLFCKWALQVQRIFTVSAKEMAGARYEKGAEAADRRNNQADGRSP